ncbi:MarR family winged helix-turn-helix transcriptional regulator [Lysobacter sp. A3-1-A15]|uniref:MarR family winged helix-turn-helix transcriptional regulator n=1 Tax=Novilysobacter viscosus TaxID=3098602 RepID=UPI002EDB83DD
MQQPNGHMDKVEDLLADWRRERPDLDVEAMAVVGRILSLGRRLEGRANVALKALGLHYTDLDVLATLRRGGKPYRLTPTELRASVLITSGAMTACLDRLEGNGLITRRDNPHDRRSTSAGLTAAGVRLIDKAIVARFEEATDAVTGLTERERTTLAALLTKMDRTLPR